MSTWFIHQNTDWFKPLTLKNSDGDIFNITSYGVTSELRADVDGRKLADITVTEDSAANGQITLSLTDVLTEPLPRGKAVIDLLVTADSGGFKYRSMSKEVIILGVVTR